MKFLHTISLYSLSGVLLGVGFIYPDFWILGLVGAAMQLKMLASQKFGQIWGSYVAWVIKYLFVLGFYWTIYPIKWLPFDFGGGELALVGLYWITVALFVGTSGLVFGLLYKLISGVLNNTRWIGYALLPVIWIAAEIAGSYLLSIFTYGPGSLLNGYFSLGYLGLLLGEHQFLLAIAKIGGVYALSGVAVIIAFWLSGFSRKQHKIKILLAPISVIGLLLLTNTFTFLPEDDYDKQTSVAVIGTSFPVEKSFNRENISNIILEQEKALAVAMSTEAAYIVLPEDARFFNQSEEAKQAKNFFNFKYPDSDVVIVDSGRVPLNGSAVLQGFVFDSQTGEHSAIHKKYLVPQGEFVPYFYATLFRFIGFGHIIDELQKLLSYTIGPNTSQADLPDHYPGVLFCFESSSGIGVRNLIKERPDLPFIAHPVSHTWFNEPQSLWSQLETSLKVQAVWNDVAIVSATQHGPSQLFLPNGAVVEPRLIDSGEHWEVGLFTVPLPK